MLFIFLYIFLDLLNSLNLTLILKTWRIWWAPNNACKWQTDLIRRLKVKLHSSNVLMSVLGDYTALNAPMIVIMQLVER